MQDIQCIFCNNTSGQIVIEENGYKGKKCHECGLIFISPRPAFPVVEDLYSNDRGLTSAEMHMSDAFDKRLHAKHNLKIVKKYVDTGSMLEIGAGGGYFLDEARKSGFEVYAIEPNKIAASFIYNKLGIPCEDSSLTERSFNGEKFDVIYHCNVLSHLFDPIREFKKIGDRLKDNGILVFETGNIGDVEKKYYSFFLEFGYPDHLFFFGESSLRKLLETTDFKIVKVYRYSILSYLIIQKIKQKLREFIRSTTMTKKSVNNNKTGVSIKTNIPRSKVAKRVYRTLLHFIRYKIGYLLPKIGRPQTVIVVARKNLNSQRLG